MNNLSSTHYSSGCRSGWTLYFDESFPSENQFLSPAGAFKEAKMADDEDLSMVSDASSGPPHYHDDNGEYFHQTGYSFYPSLQSESSSKANEKTKKKTNKKKIQQHSYLDDTASSPVFSQKRINLSKKDSSKEDFSMGFSATHVKKNFGFFQSTLGRNSSSKESGGFHGEKSE